MLRKRFLLAAHFPLFSLQDKDSTYQRVIENSEAELYLLWFEDLSVMYTQIPNFMTFSVRASPAPNLPNNIYDNGLVLF